MNAPPTSTSARPGTRQSALPYGGFSQHDWRRTETGWPQSWLIWAAIGAIVATAGGLSYTLQVDTPAINAPYGVATSHAKPEGARSITSPRESGNVRDDVISDAQRSRQPSLAVIGKSSAAILASTTLVNVLATPATDELIAVVVIGDGPVQRMRVGHSIEGWTLAAVKASSIELRQGTEILHIKHRGPGTDAMFPYGRDPLPPNQPRNYPGRIVSGTPGLEE